MRKLLIDAEEMLSILEGSLSSCLDRGALPKRVFTVFVKRSKSIRKRIKRRLAAPSNGRAGDAPKETP